MSEVLNFVDVGILQLIPEVDSQNDIVDFRVDFINEKGGRLLGALSAEGKLLSAVFPFVTDELLLQYVQTYKTAAEYHSESQFFIAEKECWFRYNVKKMGHHLLVTFDDISEKKWQEKRLTKTSRALDKIVNHNYEFKLLAFTDADGRLLKINDSAVKVIGTSEAEQLGELLWTRQWWKTDDDRLKVKQAIARAGKGEYVRHSLEIIIKGGLIFIDFSVRPVYDDDGLMVGILTEGRDLTELIQLKEKLSNTTNFLRTLLEHMPDGIARFDAGGKLIYINSLNAARWKLDEKDYQGKSILDMELPVPKKRLYSRNIKIVQQHLKKVSFITEVGDSYTYVILTPEIKEGELVSILSVSRDITELKDKEIKLQKLNEELEVMNEEMVSANLALTKSKDEQDELLTQLKVSEKRIRTLVQHSPNVIIRLSKGLKYLFVNDAIEIFTQKPTNEYVGKSVEEVGWPRLSLNKFVEGLKRSRDEKCFTKLELKFQGLNQQQCGLFYIVPEYTEAREVDSLLVIISDLTDLKENESKLIEKTRELEEVNKDLEAFTYTVSHDLRAPLRAIIGFSEKLRMSGVVTGDDELRFLNVIKANAQKMGRLIDELLKFSRINTTEIYKVKISLGSLLKEIINDLNESYEIAFDTEIDENMPAIYADRSMLKQVLNNLLSNSIKYRKPDVQLKIQVGCDVQNDTPTYYVKDNGIGFDQMFAEKVFEVFQRLTSDQSNTSVGVGLAIAKQIINKHGGKIWAESQEGKGTTIFFELPII